MISVLLINNPFDPQRDLVRFSAESGQTIREWLKAEYGPDFVDFPFATVCQLNGKPMLRREWETELVDGDHLMFVVLPQGVVAIVLAIISVTIAVAVYFLIGDPKIPGGEQPGSDAVYTLRGQNNRFRPGEPVEVVYGQCRIYPSYLTRPYSRYVGNQQYQYSLYCIGQGDFTIHSTHIDDTNTNRFSEIQIELCPPGTPVTLVESAVYPAVEVANIELLGPNEEDYTGPSGPYILNDFANPVRRIEIDINFPSGLYRMNAEGQIKLESVELLFEYRQINEAGGPIGSWTQLVNPTVSRSSSSPQRITYSQAGLTAGRYEVRGQRVSSRPDDSKRISQVRWEAAKGYAPLSNNFGNVYVIATKALATNKLNDQSARSFNVRATRKLPTWNGSAWTAPVATRNPVWAFCDIMRSTYGAKLATTYLDMPKLYSLASTLESRSDWFDWIFDQTLTVWEAAKTALRVGRCTPIPQGSLITAVRDEATATVAAVFNQHNILAGSLTKQLSMFQFQPFDGILMEYVDASSWKPETVQCVLPGRAGTNLERLKLPGCTNRNRALREGKYLQSRREYQRKIVTFRTGMEGYIPVFMDRVAISHDTVRVGQAGMVLAYNTTTNTMTLSEQVQFGPSNLQHRIVLRNDDGSPAASIVCTAGLASNQVILASDPPAALDFSPDRVPPLYAFGIADLWAFHGKVVSVKPVDFQTIEITVVNYVDDGYTYDSDVAAALDVVPVLTDPGDPEVAWVEVTGIVDNAAFINIGWELTPGAAAFIVQMRYEGAGLDTSWVDLGTFSTGPITVPVEVGSVIARVAPFSASGNVIWTTSLAFAVGSSVTLPLAPGVVAQDPFTGLSATARWAPLSDALGYSVAVWIPGGAAALRTQNVGAASSYSYSRATFQSDSPSVNTRTLEFRVSGFNAGGAGPAQVISLTNTLPAVVVDLAQGAPTGSNYPVSWEGAAAQAEADFSTFRVYASTTSGFTPGAGNLVQQTATEASTIAAPVTTYWRVGSVDVWGGETLSPQQTITV